MTDFMGLSFVFSLLITWSFSLGNSIQRLELHEQLSEALLSTYAD